MKITLPKISSAAGLAKQLPIVLSASRRRGAIGWSLMYLVFGGGLFGALVIFFALKFFGH